MRRAISFLLASVVLVPPQAFSPNCRCEQTAHHAHSPHVLSLSGLSHTFAHADDAPTVGCCAMDRLTESAHPRCRDTCDWLLNRGVVFTSGDNDRGKIPHLSVTWTDRSEPPQAMARPADPFVSPALSGRIYLWNCVWLV